MTGYELRREQLGRVIEDVADAGGLDPCTTEVRVGSPGKAHRVHQADQPRAEPVGAVGDQAAWRIGVSSAAPPSCQMSSVVT